MPNKSLEGIFTSGKFVAALGRPREWPRQVPSGRGTCNPLSSNVRPNPRFEESRMIGTMDRTEGKDIHNGRQRREKGQGQESETEEK